MARSIWCRNCGHESLSTEGYVPTICEGCKTTPAPWVMLRPMGPDPSMKLTDKDRSFMRSLRIAPE